MTVDQSTGYIYIVFYDERNLPDYYANFYLARSTDGGETYQNVKVSSSHFPVFGGFLGDYTNVSAVNGHIRPVWATMVNHSIYTAIIDTFYTIGINKNEEITPESYKLVQNYPNPFNSSTIIKYSIADTRFIQINIYDILGKKIVTLVNQIQNSGIHEINFDGTNLNSGVYFYSLEVNKQLIDTKKLLLIK